MSALETPAQTAPAATRRVDATLYTVYELSKILTTPARLETTLTRVLGALARELALRSGRITLAGHDGVPELVVGVGWTEAGDGGGHHPAHGEPVAAVLETGAPVVLDAVAGEAGVWPAGAELALLAVPMVDQAGVVGVLSVERERASAVSVEEDVRLLTMVANLVGQAVRLHRLISRDRERLLDEQARLSKLLERAGAGRPPPPTGIVGESPAILAVTEKLRIVARSNSTVLLRGESGTGKELFAQAVHRLSPRCDRPFIAVNCAALPESVLESELFGHEKGAFTNASAQRRGRFELADSGTLFLDEIGDISPAFQAKLLRVLQEGELERVGGTTTIKVDVRLVAATNRDLEDAVARGLFRADLYYRISVVPIFLPPLRARKADIAPLAREFLRRFNKEHQGELSFDESALALLGECSFPGNVRELENCVRRTATFARSATVSASDFACSHQECLSSTLWRQPAPTTAPEPREVPAAPLASAPAASAPPEGASPERERLIAAMEAAGWVQARAARMLGLTPRQIGYALKKHDVPMKKF